MIRFLNCYRKYVAAAGVFLLFFVGISFNRLVLARSSIMPIPAARTLGVFRGSGNSFTGLPGQIFAVIKGQGDGVISGFDPSKGDYIRIQGFGLTSGNAVRSIVTQDGDDAILHLPDGSSVRILGTKTEAIRDSCLQVELDRQNLIETFKDDFDSFSWYAEGPGDGQDGKGTWRTNFGWGPPTAMDSRSLGGENGEGQVYADPAFSGTGQAPFGINPFHLSKGVLEIWGETAPNAALPYIWGRKYTSGLITSKFSFSQLYGVFEIRAKLPKGKGFFPAFWLLPSDSSWPPEIDVFEMLGHDTKTFYATVHSTETREHTGLTSTIPAPDLSADFHQFAVSWEKDEVRWYFDGVEVARAPTPNDMHKPMYILANLAVGAAWPGFPDSSTVFPGVLAIDWIKAYKRKPQ